MGGDHDTEINDLVIVTLQHNTDNVFTDVMHIAFHGGHQDLAGKTTRAFRTPCGQTFRLHKRHQARNRLFHHAGGFDDLRQKHLAGTKQIPDLVHASH